jgi:prophage antirepressor-like protein
MSNNFYLDVFNKILQFNDNKIFIVFDNEGNIWFKFKDLLEILEYKDFNI